MWDNSFFYEQKRRRIAQREGITKSQLARALEDQHTVSALACPATPSTPCQIGIAMAHWEETVEESCESEDPGMRVELEGTRRTWETERQQCSLDQTTPMEVVAPASLNKDRAE